MRRVVMGHNEAGKAEVLADENVEPITVAMLPGVELHRVWELDEHPSLPVTKAQSAQAGTYFPGPDGVRFGFVTIPPGLSYEPPADVPAELLEAAAAEAEAKLPGMAATFDQDRPGVHTTHTVDYIVVVSGEGRMQTDDGVEVRLRAGECLIQNGTPHAWFNDGDQPFVVAYTICGAR
ncbi:Cupin domain-containing protein [Amycolatopsis marina]|uniref:Cupin domain-containing protein n=1 Tax=Amycolatopsis marina TaxID=490629 RepID=A0A1I1ARZ1_9PSEU|nr:cupin domain-containing protein [Amycolatopsis marina]SFB40784.1 Cupin domain-containing protein [Amycolatopsis marina]